MNINADGSWIPCPAASDFRPANLLHEDVEKLWRSGQAKELRRRVHRELCSSCMLSCSLGDSMPWSEWRRGGWDRPRTEPAEGTEPAPEAKPHV